MEAGRPKCRTIYLLKNKSRQQTQGNERQHSPTPAEQTGTHRRLIEEDNKQTKESGVVYVLCNL